MYSDRRLTTGCKMLLFLSIFFLSHALVTAQITPTGFKAIITENVQQLQLLEKMTDSLSSGQIVYSPSGDYLAIASEVGIQIYSNTINSEFRLMESENPIYSVAFSSDGHLLAGGDYEGNIYLWEIESKELVTVFEGFDSIVWKVAFFDDDNRLMSQGKSLGTTVIRVWDIASKTAISAIEYSEYPISSAIPDVFGNFVIASDSRGSLHIFDSGNGQLQLSLEQNNGGGNELLFNPDKTILVSAGVGNIVLWDWENGSQIAELRGHSGLVTSIAFNSDGTIMATGDSEGEVRIWNMRDMTELITLHENVDEIVSLTFSADDMFLISDDVYGIIYLWGIPDEN